MDNLTFLLIDKFSPNFLISSDTLIHKYETDGELRNYSKKQVIYRFNEMVEDRTYIPISETSNFQLSENTKQAYDLAKKIRAEEKERVAQQALVNSSVIQTNKSVYETNSWMVKNARRQNWLTGLNILVAATALFISYLSFQHSENDSVYRTKQSLQQEQQELRRQQLYLTVDSLAALKDSPFSSKINKLRDSLGARMLRLR